MYLKALLRSLSHRNFRLFFLGQGISLIGTWMQQIGMSWVVFQLTGSSFQLGLVLFCGQLPALFLSPLAGVLVDRWNRRRLLLLTQSIAMIQAFGLAVLDMSGTIAVWQILLADWVRSPTTAL
ncbi:MFS transporter [Methylobacter sp. S3L5C]|uniref:MFS transporter n=1 Tax=Methylobacter sp. S3L5C TaxID=2839024 RepID=UPI001FAB676B|nr:MFS transporter [Methylobacter sp. S3L5C]UOA07302.1 MFS transporter [Methylobacter sp. S3L5C]